MRRLIVSFIMILLLSGAIESKAGWHAASSINLINDQEDSKELMLQDMLILLLLPHIDKANR
ncbi:hypothetical protein [Paenibacillus kobensis]|uniref:hypothetical protein n=1 Tax=Paenibacillus kobensis TaxID=59841 RepID=UPI000FD73918|nr:hypothetical protein [Paenibacillus kobensis]